MSISYQCPSCQSTAVSTFYEVKGAPVHSVMLVTSRAEALNFPRGDISLGFCSNCGFISNYAFNSELQAYASSNYEATQRYSPTFNSFHTRLASELIERYGLRNKRIVEIGCGQGEFLTLLCKMGGNYGLGFDPAFTSERLAARLPEEVVVISDFYTERYSDISADLICCKMTLEHIHTVRPFVQRVAKSAKENPPTRVFFQVPNARYVLSTTSFWDIYYEHCSYFSPGSLSHLFRESGFELLDLWTDYDDQYLMIDTCMPGENHGNFVHQNEETIEILASEMDSFVQRSAQATTMWKEKFSQWQQAGQKSILWGGGSKSVSFLTTLELSLEQIEYVVDVNPYKAGTYVVGTGQMIVSPEFLVQYRPDRVIVMNPIYYQEVKNQLDQLNLSPEVLAIDALQNEAFV